ncbi:MAG: hypothetical protein U0T36_11560 [Saprospiraceae bacterium]
MGSSGTKWEYCGTKWNYCWNSLGMRWLFDSVWKVASREDHGRIKGGCREYLRRMVGATLVNRAERNGFGCCL